MMPTCHRCGGAMTPETARQRPELFLHDACLDTDDLAARRQRIPVIPEIVGRATRAVSGLLKVATGAPACFDPSVYVKSLGGDLVEVTVPLSGLLVDRLAAFVEQMQPPTDEEIAEATGQIAEESRARDAVIEAAIAWRANKMAHYVLATESTIARAVDNLLTIRAIRRGDGEG